METSILQKIQSELKAPKNQHNDFGNFNYRNAEDIQESLKPIFAKYGYCITITDKIVQVGNRIYIRALVKLHDEKMNEITTTVAYAREPESRKGMDEAQVTGATSSYARKYALGGMFLLDDIKDADSMDQPEAKPKQPPKPPAKTPESKPKSPTPMQEYLDSMAKAKAHLNKLTDSDEIYYAALKDHGVAHANKVETVADGNKILNELRTFAKKQKELDNAKKQAASNAPGDDGGEFSSATD